MHALSIVGIINVQASMVLVMPQFYPPKASIIKRRRV